MVLTFIDDTTNELETTNNNNNTNDNDDDDDDENSHCIVETQIGKEISNSIRSTLETKFVVVDDEKFITIDLEKIKGTTRRVILSIRCSCFF